MWPPTWLYCCGGDWTVDPYHKREWKWMVKCM